MRRLGGTTDVELDVRVLAATNRDLSESIREGRLREDLYYLLNVFTVDLPRLCERLDDIAPLAESFIREFAKANGKTLAGADSECLVALKSRDWPGNVRELRNVIQRAVIVSPGPLLTVADLCPGVQSRPSNKPESVIPQSGLSVGQALKDVERDLILQTLEQVRGNRLRAAKILGISPKTLYNKLGRYQSHEANVQTRSTDLPQR